MTFSSMSPITWKLGSTMKSMKPEKCKIIQDLVGFYLQLKWANMTLYKGMSKSDHKSWDVDTEKYVKRLFDSLPSHFIYCSLVISFDLWSLFDIPSDIQ